MDTLDEKSNYRKQAQCSYMAQTIFKNFKKKGTSYTPRNPQPEESCGHKMVRNYYTCCRRVNTGATTNNTALLIKATRFESLEYPPIAAPSLQGSPPPPQTFPKPKSVSKPEFHQDFFIFGCRV